MKISKLIGCCIVALAAIVGVNVQVASVGLSSSTLNVSNVENVAEGWEWIGWSNFFNGYGFCADESAYTGQCPRIYSLGSSNSMSGSSNGNVGYGGATVGGGSSYSASNSGNYSVQYSQDQNPGYWIKCKNGDYNCDEEECWRPK